ncbi:hypothetical protein [Phycicoccus flavus]|uniref:hypothetical protein n=1 Tax=Phycicoccus flavus TaxID=2502783 RepID=UPI000FEC1B21|nr:hypothetical protein [Phycicoccus flavus]NHA70329.1 hypothetical protein [Phycicoccus flavus]
MWSRFLVAVAGVLLAVAIAVRTGLVGFVWPGAIIRLGWYGPDADRLTSLVLAGSLAAFLLAGLHLRGRRQATTSEPGAVVGPVAAVLGLVVAATSAVAVVFPDTPYDAAAPACRGAYLQGSDFYAQTVAGGASARTGPGRGFPQVDRFAGDCTLGFSGYCIGEPVTNDLSDLVDARWLIVNGSENLVSSAVLQVQSQPASTTAATPDPRCAKLGGFPLPNALKFTAKVSRQQPNQVKLTATAKGAPLIGYAEKIVDPVDGVYPYTPIGSPKSNAPRFAGVWIADSDVDLLKGRTGRMHIAASACLSAGFPIGDPAVYEARFKAGRIVSLKALAQLPGDASMLANTACYGTRN